MVDSSFFFFVFFFLCFCCFFFFQAEDGIRDLVRSRGLGDVYKRQVHTGAVFNVSCSMGGQKLKSLVHKDNLQKVSQS